MMVVIHRKILLLSFTSILMRIYEWLCTKKNTKDKKSKEEGLHHQAPDSLCSPTCSDRAPPPTPIPSTYDETDRPGPSLLPRRNHIDANQILSSDQHPLPSHHEPAPDRPRRTPAIPADVDLHHRSSSPLAQNHGLPLRKDSRHRRPPPANRSRSQARSRTTTLCVDLAQIVDLQPVIASLVRVLVGSLSLSSLFRPPLPLSVDLSLSPLSVALPLET
ncbi:hypothetical protein RJT34_32092 [Clitoria ternatea]|uniref:Uncharacterized protein n=1 Tax=Clitoria ternatea TaxID=43366 RepID=A0AAN9F398_CLITE